MASTRSSCSATDLITDLGPDVDGRCRTHGAAAVRAGAAIRARRRRRGRRHGGSWSPTVVPARCGDPSDTGPASGLRCAAVQPDGCADRSGREGPPAAALIAPAGRGRDGRGRRPARPTPGTCSPHCADARASPATCRCPPSRSTADLLDRLARTVPGAGAGGHGRRAAGLVRVPRAGRRRGASASTSRRARGSDRTRSPTRTPCWSRRWRSTAPATGSAGAAATTTAPSRCGRGCAGRRPGQEPTPAVDPL